jgi:flagellin-specific chaperone FliS
MLARKPADAYRRVDLDARVEASAGEDLTRICLEQAADAISQALMALDRRPDQSPREPLGRAQGIALWLARSVAPDNPLRDPMMQFYGGLAATIARNMGRASVAELAQVRDDFSDLLQAAKAA